MIALNTPDPDATLKTLLAIYCGMRDVSATTQIYFERAINSFTKYLGRPATAADLSMPVITAWLATHKETLSVFTIRNYREGIRGLWRALHRAKLVKHGVPERPIKAKPKAKKTRRLPLPAGWADKSKPQGELAGKSLMDYHRDVFTPAKTAEGSGSKIIEDAARAIKWFRFYLKREPMMGDLSDMALSDLQRLIVAEGRTPLTARFTVERLLSLWRFAVWRGDMTSGDTLPPSRVARPMVSALKADRPPKKKRHGLSKQRPPQKIPLPDDATTAKPIDAPPPRPAEPATKETTLEDFIGKYYVPSHDLKPSTIAGYLFIVPHFSRYLQRPPTIADLNADTLNGLLTHLMSLMERETARGYRRTLLMLWRWAFETEVVEQFPRRVRPIKCPSRIIEGYDTKQMTALVEAADKLPGSFRKTGIERRLWWRAFLLVGWYSGLRLSDVLAIQRDQITMLPDGSGELTIIMEKTGNAIRRLLPPEVVQAIDDCMASGSPRKLCFPLWAIRRFYFRDFRQLATSAGLKGTTKWIRRGSASEVEKLHSGGGRTHLGHRSPDLFEKAYRVGRIVEGDIKLPPSIGRKDGAA